MARYIDADKAKEKKVYSKERREYVIPVAEIDWQPVADVVEVKHGEWERQNGGFFFLCSVCGKAAATKGNYCHNCGAKMDGQ